MIHYVIAEFHVEGAAGEPRMSYVGEMIAAKVICAEDARTRADELSKTETTLVRRVREALEAEHEHPVFVRYQTLRI